MRCIFCTTTIISFRKELSTGDFNRNTKIYFMVCANHKPSGLSRCGRLSFSISAVSSVFGASARKVLFLSSSGSSAHNSVQDAHLLKMQYGFVQHRIDQLRIRTGTDSPADYHTIKAVDDRRKIHLACGYMESCKIRQPFLVWCIRMEVPRDEIFYGRADFHLTGAVNTSFCRA